MGTFSGKKIRNTYQGIVQYSGSKFYDALGNQISASIDITSSYATFSELSNTSNTASYIEGVNVDGSVDYAVNATIAVLAVTSSYATSTDYLNINGIPTGIVSSSSQIETQISGAFDSVSASLASAIEDIVGGTVTVATASYAISASHEITYELSSSYADFALTASYSLNSLPGFPFTGSAEITGSLNVIGPVTASGFRSSGGVGNPSFISSTILNLSASAAVAINNTVFRLASFTDSQTSSLTPQNGDVIFNSTSQRAQLYTGSEFVSLLLTGDVEDTTVNISALNDFTGSADSRLDALESVTGSYLTGADTGSFATTGSNVFIGNQTISGSLFVSGGTDLSGTNTISGSNTIVGATSIGSIGTGRTLIYGTTEYNAGYTHFRAPNLVNFESTPIFEVGLEVTGSIDISGSVSISNNLTVEGSILGIITSASYATTASYAESTPSIPGVSGTGLGWARYDDGVYNTGSVFNVTVAGGEVTLPNSASTVINEHMHSTVEFYDSASAKIQVENLNDVYMQTVVFKAKTGNANGTYVRIQLDSTAGTPYERVGKDLFFNKGNDIWHEFHEVFQYYADSDFVSNGNRWKIQAFNQDVEVADIIYFIQRTQNHGVE